MSSDPTRYPPDTEPKSVGGWWRRNKATLMPLVTALAAALIGSVLTYVGVPPRVTETVTEVIRYVEAPAPEGGTDGHSFGWLADQDQIAANLDPVRTTQFAATPAGQVAQGDEDVFLYRTVRKVNARGPPWYPNINQGSVGCCVGAGSKHGTDVVQATAIASGQQFEWKPASAEVIYSMSRIDVGGGQIRGDGSVGRWACEAMKNGALAPMEKIGAHDLTQFSPARARQWGSTGVPREVKDVAKGHPVKGAALVKSAVDVKRAIGQSYPVVVCSDVGFNNRDGSVGTRDKDGFCAARGTWPHCMCFIGWRNGSRPGALCLNSWGDTAHGGPVWPDDQPVAAFWVEEATVQRMVSQGDSFALSDVQGFPARNPKPDWFARVEPRQPAPAAREVVFALAP